MYNYIYLVLFSYAEIFINQVDWQSFLQIASKLSKKKICNTAFQFKISVPWNCTVIFFAKFCSYQKTRDFARSFFLHSVENV